MAIAPEQPIPICPCPPTCPDCDDIDCPWCSGCACAGEGCNALFHHRNDDRSEW